MRADPSPHENLAFCRHPGGLASQGHLSSCQEAVLGEGNPSTSKCLFPKAPCFQSLSPSISPDGLLDCPVFPSQFPGTTTSLSILGT